MNRRLNYLLFNNSFIIFVFLGIIFKVDYISNYQILNNAFNILIMLTFILVCFLYLLHKKYDKLDYLIVTYLIIIGVSTIINNQDIVYYVFKKIPFLTIYFYTKLCLKYDERKYEALMPVKEQEFIQLIEKRMLSEKLDSKRFNQ